MSRRLRRLFSMSGRELAWRAGAASRVALDAAHAVLRPPRWTRGPDAAAEHREISREVAASTRFVIARTGQRPLVDRIALACPHATRHAAARADRIVFGHYDLLGYCGLRFDGSGRFEWNYDPVHDRRAPDGFWNTIPYLDPSIGDHKVIWELNRHQHWLALGRAYWLTTERRYRDRCLAELASWLDANPPLMGVNWTSMLELALRSLSWIWALHFFADPDIEDPSPWTADLAHALDRQLTHIEQNLSYYFSPNTHLTGEALALYVAGRSLPWLPHAIRRADVGRRVLVAEIDRQIAHDGGHRERSAHYHRYTHDFYALALIVARITDDPIAPTFARALARIAFATRVLADAQGTLPHLGDDDGGTLTPLTGRRVDDVRDSLALAAALLDRPALQIGSAPEETYWCLANPTFDNQSAILNPQSSILGSVALEETGYYVSRRGGTQVIVDGGPHGYQNAGHAHADALAVTVTLRGVPLLIDPGTGCYTVDAEVRERLRSTAMHNTITIDDRSQSIPDGPFQWSRTADSSVVRWRTNDGFDYFDGTHDGYGAIAHRRRVLVLHGTVVLVADLIDGAAQASAHWHLDPRWHVEIDGSRAIVTAAGERAGLFAVGAPFELFRADRATGLGWYSPVYGRVDATTTLRLTAAGDGPRWLITVIDLSPDNPIVSVDSAPIWTEAGALAHGTAVRMTRSASIDYALLVEPHRVSDSWRIAEFETDARVLFCRTEQERRVTTLALVDGSFVRGSGHRGLQLALPAVTPDLHLDLSGDARIAGPAMDAQLLVNGRERQMTREGLKTSCAE